MTVFILGAGCSKNYSEQESITVPGVKPPLQTDFFDIADAYLKHAGMPPHLDTSFPSSRNVIDTLLEFYCGLSDLPGKQQGPLREQGLQALHERKISLEDAMTLLETAVAHKRAFRIHYFRDYHIDQLIDIMARALAIAFSAGPCALHARLAQYITQQLSRQPHGAVISFNYDTLIDDALDECLGPNSARYIVDFSYCREYETVQSDEEGRKIYRDLKFSPPSFEEPPFCLLKLHGSLNWLRCDTCGTTMLDKGASDCRSYMSFLHGFLEGYAEFDSDRDLKDWLQAQRSIGSDVSHISHLLDAAKKRSWQGFERQRIITCEHCSEVMKRVVVPPLLSKTYSDPLFAGIWIQAARELQPFQNYVVIGYSMPLTDIGSRLLFKGNTRTWAPLIRGRRGHLDVVDPSEEARQRVKAHFAHTGCQEYETLAEFLDSRGV